MKTEILKAEGSLEEGSDKWFNRDLNQMDSSPRDFRKTYLIIYFLPLYLFHMKNSNAEITYQKIKSISNIGH